MTDDEREMLLEMPAVQELLAEVRRDAARRGWERGREAAALYVQGTAVIAPYVSLTISDLARYIRQLEYTE